MSESDVKVIAALAAAVTSLLVAVIGFFGTRSNQHDIELLRASLVETKAKRDARREYEYEALKRLYLEYEPLFFHLVESCQNAVE